MKVRAIDFVQISVSDMGRAVRFYRDTLGMDFPLSGGDNMDWNWKEFDTPPVALALDSDARPAPGQVNLALAVDDVAARQLRRDGRGWRGRRKRGSERQTWQGWRRRAWRRCGGR